MKKDISKIAFHSKLFKGRSNWYFCYLKAEKLAHVLGLLASKSVSDAAEALKGTANFASQITQDVVYASAGEVMEETLLADLFSIISTIRLHAGREYINRETARVLIEEYEGMVDRLVGDNRHFGLTVSTQDLAVPAIAEEPLFTALPSPLNIPSHQGTLKDTLKGHQTNRTIKDNSDSKGQNRALQILDFVRKSNGVSIKDIAKIVQGCSEKTIQRELGNMIERGQVIREGERRWSTYRAA